MLNSKMVKLFLFPMIPLHYKSGNQKIKSAKHRIKMVKDSSIKLTNAYASL